MWYKILTFTSNVCVLSAFVLKNRFIRKTADWFQIHFYLQLWSPYFTNYLQKEQLFIIEIVNNLYRFHNISYCALIWRLKWKFSLIIFNKNHFFSPFFSIFKKIWKNPRIFQYFPCFELNYFVNFFESFISL